MSLSKRLCRPAETRPAVVFLSTCLLTFALQAGEPSSGHWIGLFDGETLFGWQSTSNADWSTADGTIQVTRGEPGWLRTTSAFADFELQLEYQAELGTNSGVFIRMNERPQDPTSDCYEINITTDGPFTTGSLVGRAKAEGKLAQDDKWHLMAIRADGPRIEVLIDGKRQCDYQDLSPIRRGFIGLQLNQGAVKFRSIRLRPLNLQSLIGADLSDWQTALGMQGEFTVATPGTLHVRGGPGQIETKKLFANFVLQTECRTNAKGVNSGIFFRCIPGDRAMGYESQIDNTFTNSRTQPTNCGTGGIFRRVDARRVVANDLEWFQKTIIATGDHVAVWVNGYQVTDWTDTRPAHTNPRRGLRLKAGSIILQAHDPTTDLEFRGMGAAER